MLYVGGKQSWQRFYKEKYKTIKDIFSTSLHLPRGQVRFSNMLNLRLLDLKCFFCYAS